MILRCNTYFAVFLSVVYYMLRFPNEVLRHIYSFDPTYHHIYKICIDELYNLEILFSNTYLIKSIILRCNKCFSSL